MRVPFLALIALTGMLPLSAYGQYYQQMPPPGYAPYPMTAAPAQYTMPYAPMPGYAMAPGTMPGGMMPNAVPQVAVFSQGQLPTPATADTSLETTTSHELANAVHGSCHGNNCDHCCAAKCNVGCCLHRSAVFADYLNLQARGVDVAYAVPQDGIGGLGTAPVGRVGTTNFDNHSGFRAGVVMAIDCCSSVTGTFTWYETDIEDVTVSPLVIQPLVAFPGTFNAGFTAQTASANNHMDFQFADIDYRAIWRSGPNYYINFLLGARYAHLDQEFSATFPFAPPNGTTFVQTDINFDGGGIRFGGDGQRQIVCDCGLAAYGKFVGNLLAGETRSSYQQTNQFNGVEAFTDWKDSRLIGIWEAELGLSWTSANGTLRLAAGYYVAIWTNVTSTPEYINAVQNQNYVDVAQDSKDTITFDGLVARVEINL